MVTFILNSSIFPFHPTWRSCRERLSCCRLQWAGPAGGRRVRMSDRNLCSFLRLRLYRCQCFTSPSTKERHWSARCTAPCQCSLSWASFRMKSLLQGKSKYQFAIRSQNGIHITILTKCEEILHTYHGSTGGVVILHQTVYKLEVSLWKARTLSWPLYCILCRVHGHWVWMGKWETPWKVFCRS